jgi:hypothetical protein
MYQEADFSTSTTAVSSETFYFSLGNFIDYASVQAFFDQYKLLSIDFEARPRSNSLDIGANQSIPPTYCVLDYDNVASLASPAAALSYDNCMQLNAYESFKRTFKPRIALAAYQGAFSGYANASDMWLDTSSSSIQHFGLKLFSPVTGVATSWDILIRGIFAARQVH